MICYEHYSVILHIWIGEDLKKVAAKLTFTLKFKVRSFLLHRILFIMKMKSLKGTMDHNSIVLLERNAQ